jgi:hypothetical protein
MGYRAITQSQVEIVADLVHAFDADGEQFRVVKLTGSTGKKLRTVPALSPQPSALPV